MNKILLVLALICFILAAVGVGFGSVGLVPLGLAFWVATSLTGNQG